MCKAAQKCPKSWIFKFVLKTKVPNKKWWVYSCIFPINPFGAPNSHSKGLMSVGVTFASFKEARMHSFATTQQGLRDSRLQVCQKNKKGTHFEDSTLCVFYMCTYMFTYDHNWSYWFTPLGDIARQLSLTMMSANVQATWFSDTSRGFGLQLCGLFSRFTFKIYFESQVTPLLAGEPVLLWWPMGCCHGSTPHKRLVLISLSTPNKCVSNGGLSQKKVIRSAKYNMYTVYIYMYICIYIYTHVYLHTCNIYIYIFIDNEDPF